MCQENSIITVRIPMCPLMASGETIWDINALFGELKSQRGEQTTLLTETVLV